MLAVMLKATGMYFDRSSVHAVLPIAKQKTSTLIRQYLHGFRSETSRSQEAVHDQTIVVACYSEAALSHGDSRSRLEHWEHNFRWMPVLLLIRHGTG